MIKIYRNGILINTVKANEVIVKASYILLNNSEEGNRYPVAVLNNEYSIIIKDDR